MSGYRLGAGLMAQQGEQAAYAAGASIGATSPQVGLTQRAWSLVEATAAAHRLVNDIDRRLNDRYAGEEKADHAGPRAEQLPAAATSIDIAAQQVELLCARLENILGGL